MCRDHTELVRKKKRVTISSQEKWQFFDKVPRSELVPHMTLSHMLKRSYEEVISNYLGGSRYSSPQWQMVTTNVLLVPRKNGAFYDLVFQEVLRILGFSKSRLPNCYQDFTHFLFDSNQKDISAAFSLSPESFLMRMKEMKNVRKRRAGM